MSSLWTPDGERPVGKNSPQTPGQPQTPQQSRNPAGFSEATPPPPAGGVADDSEATAEQRRQMEELQQQLAETPVEVVVANHCFGLFELAALHLSMANLAEAQLAIDALGALVESLTGRLGEAEPHLRDGLNQLRMAFVQIRQRADQN